MMIAREGTQINSIAVYHREHRDALDGGRRFRGMPVSVYAVVYLDLCFSFFNSCLFVGDLLHQCC